jgi:hypothetical protein
LAKIEKEKINYKLKCQKLKKEVEKNALKLIENTTKTAKKIKII